MNATFRRNRGIAEAFDACRHLQEQIESLAIDAEILRRVKDADCAGEMLAMLRHREQSIGSISTEDLGRRQSAISAALAAVSSAFSRYDLSALDDEDAEILRLAHCTRSRLEALDAAGLAMRQRAVKASNVNRDLSPSEIATLSDFADPWRLDA